MTLKALIIDDEPLAHDIILEYTKSVPFLKIAGQCYLATEAISKINQQEIDLLFLDIQMPKIKGLDFLRTLKNPPLVIITSAYEEYALESFELDVCDYLHKPYRFDRFLKACNKALEWQQLRKQPTIPKQSARQRPEPATDHIFIKSDKKHVKVNLKEIYYLESYGNYVKIWLADTFVLTPATLSSFEESFPSNLFLRIHKSFIINKEYIDYLEGNRLFLKNGRELSVGKSYRHLVKKWFQ